MRDEELFRAAESGLEERYAEGYDFDDLCGEIIDAEIALEKIGTLVCRQDISEADRKRSIGLAVINWRRERDDDREPV